MKTSIRSLPSSTHLPRELALRLCVTHLLAVLALGTAIGTRAQIQLRPSASPQRVQAPAATTTRMVRPKFDYSGIGGSVYATGLGDVVVAVHPVGEFLSDGFYPYVTTVHARLGDREQLLGSNRDKCTVRLGPLERGEIRLVGRCPDGDGILESGPGNRNADGAPRSRVKEVQPGVVEVYFENTIVEGTRSDRTEQHWYKDFKLTFTGAVTADPGMILLLGKINDPDPATRGAAREALKLASPMMARQAGVR